MAAPLAMLGAVAQCAHRGIVVRDGAALERMSRVDTVVLDPAALRTGDPVALRALIVELRRRGIEHVALAEDAGHAATLRREGRTVCFVGNGVEDPAVLGQVDVSVSLRAAGTIGDDAAQVVLLDGDVARLCELRDIAHELDRNLGRGRSMVVAANVACVAGVFTMGLGIMAAVAINQLAALAALVSGARPLGRVAQLEAERQHRLELYRYVAEGPAASGSPRTPTALASPAAAAYDGS
jgi:Cu2+-exporting ATPase